MVQGNDEFAIRSSDSLVRYSFDVRMRGRGGERERIVPCSNGVDHNESFRFSSKYLVVLVEIRGVEWKCWWFCENETTLVFYANGEGGDVRFFLEKEKNPRSLDDERFVVVGGTGSAGHTSDFSGFKRRKVGFEY